MGVEGAFLNLIKAIYEKPTGQHHTQLAKSKSFPTKIRNKTRMSALTTFIQHSLEVLATAIRQEKEIKGIQIGKDEGKLSLFADDMIVYIEPYRLQKQKTKTTTQPNK